MTQEEKFILLQELSARLPYGVKVFAGENLAMTLRQIDYQCFCECWENEDFKSNSRWMLPYLRPMESMTEDEEKEFRNVINEECGCNGIHLIGNEGGFIIHYSWVNKCIDWLNKKMFDYRGLIPMGLALSAKEGMYIIK